MNASLRSTPGSSTRPLNSGVVLVAVLVVVLLSSMLAVSLMFRLRAEQTASATSAGSEQAWAAAMSGVQEAIRFASVRAPGALEWLDAPGIFKDHLVFEDGAERWYYTVYTMGDPERQDLRFGLTDEASLLNLKVATEPMLSKLPKMTPYLVQGLLDFQDTDPTPRPEGAEQEYYDALAHPYTVLNRPLASLDELLLVRGFTPSVVYGEDANQNFLLDPNEDDAEEQFPPDNRDGMIDCGFRQLVTVCSYDLNEDNQENLRININDKEDPLPEKDVPPQVAQYISALRRSGSTLAHPADLLEAKAKLKDESGKEAELESGVGKAELSVVLDRFTTTMDYILPGLVNVNTASAGLLRCLPEIDDAMADSIVSARRGLRPEQKSTIAWLYQEDLLDADRFKKVAPLLTARSLQFRFQVLGYGAPSGRYRVLEVVIDVAGLKPAIIYLRDITRLGLPFKLPLQPAGQETLTASPLPASSARLSKHFHLEAPHG